MDPHKAKYAEEKENEPVQKRIKTGVVKFDEVTGKAQENDLKPLLEVKTDPELDGDYESSERTAKELAREMEGDKDKVKSETLLDMETEVKLEIKQELKFKVKSEVKLDDEDDKHSPEEYFEHEKVEDRDIKESFPNILPNPPKSWKFLKQGFVVCPRCRLRECQVKLRNLRRHLLQVHNIESSLNVRKFYLRR